MRVAGMLVFTFVACTGCEQFSLFREPDPQQDRVIKTGTIQPVSQANAERLDRVGRQIISTNPFLGSAPVFGLVGSQEPEIYHPNPEAVFVSEGVLHHARKDDVLAGVLCLELARINLEARNRAKLGFKPINTDLPGPETEPDPDQADLGDAQAVGGTTKRLTVNDADSLEAMARKWHKAAGYEESAFADALTLDRAAVMGNSTSKLMIGTGAAPKWTR